MTQQRRQRQPYALVIIVAALAALVCFALPAASRAAEVEVDETDQPPNRAVLEFVAEGDEDNAVTLSSREVGEFLEVEVRDEGSSLDPGEGCEGDDASGTVVCKLHKPFEASFPICKGCGISPAQRALELSWHTSITIDLRDGDDTLDTTGLGGLYTSDVSLNVFGRSGRDTISTGFTDDTVYPGKGDDDIRSGNGYDTVIADPSVDGSDHLSLGDDPGDTVSFAQRREPIVLDGTTVGSAGEKDVLSGVIWVTGSAGDDLFTDFSRTKLLVDGGDGNDLIIGGAEADEIRGGSGNDLIVGGANDDTIFGGGGDDTLHGDDGRDFLIGGEGNDAFNGGPGPDQLLEQRPVNLFTQPTTFGAQFEVTGGSDIADGGEGDDLIVLGPGADTAEGNLGNDFVYGVDGDDRLAGGAGDDTVAGGAGSDRLWGGPGADVLRTSLMREHSLEMFPAKEIDGWRDLVRCGPDTDRALVNRWDDVRQCERARVVPLVRFLKTFRDRRAGTAELSISVGAPGRLVMFGRGVRKVVRRLTATVEDPEVTTLLPVRPRHRAARSLRRHSRATVRLTIRYRPDGGVARTEKRRLRLVRRR